LFSALNLLCDDVALRNWAGEMRTKLGVGTGKRKRGLLPLLVVLFLISYGLLTMMVVEQNRTIISQRTLIHLLYKDSLHLSALKKAERQKAHTPAGAATGSLQADAQVQAGKIPVIQVPPQKSPSTQFPSAQVPTDKKQQTGGRAEHKQKAQKKAPRPPAELTDPSDMRRVSVAI
jgi:hypothetical protein